MRARLSLPIAMAGISLLALILGGRPSLAEPRAVAAVPTEDARTSLAPLDTGAPPEVMANGTPAPTSPLAAALRQVLTQSPLMQNSGGLSEREAEERAAMITFYEARANAPIWLTNDRANDKAEALIAEITSAGEWGLDPADFTVPKYPDETATADQLAATETSLTLTALKYARLARGGRIMHPNEQLSSYLDRAPQLQSPKLTLDALATSADAGAVLRGLHPQHPQFEKLRQKYLALRNAAKPNRHGVRTLTSDAKRLLANMEQWRWMPADMGDLYVWNNIPEYTLRVMKDNSLVHTERIVAGLITKQTPIFSRPMRKIVFRPRWIVPESIKVREVWPSLVHGGGVMASFGLHIETKDGQTVPTKSVNWAKADIRNYEVIQAPGPHAILGNFKFAFPNQHTVFMHDTQDKHLFAATQRTYSHGCMRVRNPAKLAEVIMAADKGWDGAKIAELVKTGPLDNQVPLDRKVLVHITYFTAWVGEDGKVQTFKDVYGHERRITQALSGRWNEIVKGPDHLAPVEPDMAAVSASATRRQSMAQARPQPAAKPFNFLSAVFGNGF
jgi:L,D-transpeptidase YcbB